MIIQTLNSWKIRDVWLLLRSPVSTAEIGLFARVILMSGSALSPTTIARDSEFFTQSLAKAVNCDSNSGSSSSAASSSQDHHLLTQSSQVSSQSSSSSSSSPSSHHQQQQHQQTQLLECLRSKSVDELTKVNFGIDDSFRVSFGPIIDGLLIPVEPASLMESDNASGHHLSYLHPLGLKSNSQSRTPHSLLFGVSACEAPLALFSENEEKNGIDGLRRDRILYSFIKNIIDYYQEVSLVFLSYLPSLLFCFERDNILRLTSSLHVK